jgi:hypothetical protein
MPLSSGGRKVPQLVALLELQQEWRGWLAVSTSLIQVELPPAEPPFGGLGWYGMSAGPALLIGIIVYVVQVFVSAAWLRRYRFGPVEWLWRTMMYGYMQPLKRRHK